MWASGSLVDLFPNLAHFANNLDISVKEVSEANFLEDLFDIPISQQAALELDGLRLLIQDFDIPGGMDQRIFCWGNNKYTVAKLYKLAFLNVQTPAVFRWVWRSKVTPRVKFFAWLILLDRLNTKNMLARRNFNVQPDSLCALCDDGLDETVDHLFFDCPFAKKCWDKIGISWVSDGEIHRRIERTKPLTGMPFFMEIFLLAAWELWKIRNRLVFDGAQACFNRWLQNFKDEAVLQSFHIKEADRVSVLLWLDSL